jgi:hypothetical protein
VRTAVCLSGQARYISENFENIRDSLIVPTDADVFCHFWDTEGGNIEPRKALEVFSPVTFSLETQRLFDTHPAQVTLTKHATSPNAYQNVHSMYYSILQANLLKQRYEKEQGFTYDCEIRSRTDITFDKVFNWDEFNSAPHSLWLRNFDRSPAGKSCADLFAFSNSKLMNIYSDCFQHMPRLIQEGQHCYAETILHDYIGSLCEISLTSMCYKIIGK